MSSARDHFVFAKQLIDAKTLAHLREPNHRGLIVLVETWGLFRTGRIRFPRRQPSKQALTTVQQATSVCSNSDNQFTEKLALISFGESCGSPHAHSPVRAAAPRSSVETPPKILLAGRSDFTVVTGSLLRSHQPQITTILVSLNFYSLFKPALYSPCNWSTTVNSVRELFLLIPGAIRRGYRARKQPLRLHRAFPTCNFVADDSRNFIALTKRGLPSAGVSVA